MIEMLCATSLCPSSPASYLPALAGIGKSYYAEQSKIQQSCDETFVCQLSKVEVCMRSLLRA